MNTTTPTTVYEQLANLGITEAALLPPTEKAEGRLRRFVVAPSLTTHVRHRSKYFDTPVAKEHEFVTLAFDPVEQDIMRQPPRDPQSPLIDRGLVWRIVYVSVLISLGTFGLFFYELELGSSLEAARAVAVNAIVFFEVAYVFNSRHLNDSVLNRHGILGNRIVWWGIAAVVIFQVVFTYWLVMNSLFHVAPLDAWMWLRVLGVSLLLMLLVEIEKAVGRRLAWRSQPAP